jgi:membrane protease subunit HflK
MSSRPPWSKTEISVPQLPPIRKRTIAIVGAILLLLVVGGLSYYQVEPDEEAIILQFGQYTGETAKPGPHFRIPLVHTVSKVPVQRQLKQEFGFRTVQPGVRTSYSRVPEEARMLTGDLNVADVEWVVQYRIRDPYKYLFKVREVGNTFRDLNEAVMRGVVGDHSVDEVITIGREQIAGEAKERLQQLADLYDTGIKVEQLVLQDVNPPDKVQPSFNEVNQAIQEKERLINEAWAAYNRSVPRARGEAEQRIREAEGYALERVNRAEGEASRFSQVYEEFRKAPDVTRQRLYLETLERIVPRLGEKVIVDEDLENLLPLLELGAGKSLPKGGE